MGCALVMMFSNLTTDGFSWLGRGKGAARRREERGSSYCIYHPHPSFPAQHSPSGSSLLLQRERLPVRALDLMGA